MYKLNKHTCIQFRTSVWYGWEKETTTTILSCITIHFHTYTITLFVITAIVWPLGDILFYFFLFILKNDLCSFITWIDCSLNFNKADKNDIIFFVLFCSWTFTFFFSPISKCLNACSIIHLQWDKFLFD